MKSKQVHRSRTLSYFLAGVGFVFVTGGAWAAVLLQTVVPYLIPDTLKLVLALRLTVKLRKYSTAL